MPKLPHARTMMKDWYMTLAPDTALVEAIDDLVAKGAAGAPVVDAHGRLMGVLTEKDCLRVLARIAYGHTTGGVVADFMSPIKSALDPDMDLLSVANTFLQCNFPVLPVVEDGRPLGRVSRQDLLRAVQTFLHRVEEERERTQTEQELHENPTSIESLQQLAAKYTPEQLASVLRHRRSEE